MNIRKILNLPTKEQKLVLNKDIKKIMEGCDSIASVEWKEQKENQKSHDGQCPNCRVQKDIVEKIRQVKGKGNVGGDFKLGFGSINGSLDIDTHEVNHCNNCGNQWKKFETKYITNTDIIKVALNYLGDIYHDPERNKTYSWKHDAIKVFEDCHAEAIKLLVNKYDYKLHGTSKKVLKLKKLRIEYKSIFDK